MNDVDAAPLKGIIHDDEKKALAVFCEGRTAELSRRQVELVLRRLNRGRRRTRLAAEIELFEAQIRLLRNLLREPTEAA